MLRLTRFASSNRRFAGLAEAKKTPSEAGTVSARKVKTHISTFSHPYLNLKDYGVQKREGWGVRAATSAFRESGRGQMDTKSRSRMIERSSHVMPTRVCAMAGIYGCG